LERKVIIRWIAGAVFSLSAFAADPNQWHHLVLDQASPEQAVKELGQPVQDVSGAFQPTVKKLCNIHNSVLCMAARIARSSPTATNLPVRAMLFDQIGGFKHVGLLFREERLAMIGLEPDKANKILAADVENEYGVPFRPIFNQTDFDAMWTMWDQTRQEVRPRQYPDGYSLIGLSPGGDAGVIASIQNMSFGKQLAGVLSESTTHVPLADEKNPGVVFQLTLLSAQGMAIPRKPQNSTLK
jgi:hypothetical protein